MLPEQNAPEKSFFKNPLVYSTLIVGAVLLYVGWIVFSRWHQNRSLERRATVERTEKQREQERQKLEELHRKAQEAERQRLAELRREAERQREQVEEEREAERRCHQDRERGAAVQSLTEWWRILEVAPSATKEEIVHNYRRKIQQCHPDRVSGLAPEFLELAEERSKALNAAYAQAIRAQH